MMEPKEGGSMEVRVGKPVSEIQAQALGADGAFKNVKLSDYKGELVIPLKSV